MKQQKQCIISDCTLHLTYFSGIQTFFINANSDSQNTYSCSNHFPKSLFLGFGVSSPDAGCLVPIFNKTLKSCVYPQLYQQEIWALTG